jgi:uncharacterized protein YbaR (Trm112 family)|tara:strand:+ start:6338 stop:6598 length:261 start_codon:yes stop_codon:yes gene_type:complete
MSIENSFLEYICCPITKQPLDFVSRELLSKINKSINKSKISRKDGRSIDQSLTDALITKDKKIVYPIYDDFPVLIEDYAILMEQIK